MPLRHKTYVPTHPGLEGQPGGAIALMHASPEEGPYAHFGTNHLAEMVNRNTLIHFGDIPYNASELTETKTNSSTIVATGPGVRFQTATPAVDGDNVEIVSARTFVPASASVDASGQTTTPSRYVASTRARVSSAANLGLSFGFVTAGATGVVAANPTDMIAFIKAKNSAALKARTVQNGGAAHDLALFNPDNSQNPVAAAVNLADATFIELGIKFSIGDTIAHSWGEWWINGNRTPMTAAQVTDIFNMVAAAHAMSAQLGFAVNGTTQRNGVVDWCLVEVDK